MERTTYLILAYMIIWAGVAGYLAWLSGLQRRSAQRLEELTSQIRKQELPS